jgi:phage protein D
VGAREDTELARAFQNREEVITTHPVQSEDEARTLALETLERIAKGMLTGSGATVGLPDIRTGTVLDIDGLGSRFSGRYFVTATTHTIGDSGYTTQFECRREEL